MPTLASGHYSLTMFVNAIPSTSTVIRFGAFVPDAPTMVLATPGNALVSVAFAAPASDGDSAITGYTASCGASSVSGPGSPIVVTGLTNGTPVSCTVIATNAVGDSQPSQPSAAAASISTSAAFRRAPC